jgi:hypothetical protein
VEDSDENDEMLNGWKDFQFRLIYETEPTVYNVIMLEFRLLYMMIKEKIEYYRELLK